MAAVLTYPFQLVYAAFDRAFPYVNWAFFLLGLTGFVLTMFGVFPGAGEGWFGKMLAGIGWALLAKDGYSDLQDGK